MFTKVYLKAFLVIFILFSFSTSSFSQFSIVSTSPANGDANIDTAATMFITFNAAIDTSVRFLFPGDIFIELFFSPDTLVNAPDSVTFSPDMHTVYFHNLHLSDNTDYRFCIFNAKSMSGDSLDRPYSYTFTTNSMMLHTATVAGTISPDPTGAMVFLFDSNPFESDNSEWSFWAVVPNSTGNYLIDFVPAGIYWPIASKDFYIDEEGDIEIQNGSKIAYLDSNNDYRPDSIHVPAASSIPGIDMVLHDVYQQTARNPLTNLNLIVQNWTSDAQLVEFGGDNILADGTSMFWQYTYYSPSLMNSKSWMTAGDVIVSIIDDSLNTDTTALPLNWLDSDSIMSVAEDNGGADFRQQYEDAQVFGGCGYLIPEFGKHKESMNVFKEKFPEDINIKKAVWSLEYYSDMSGQYFHLLIDALNGNALNVQTTASESEEEAYQIAQEWAPDVRLWALQNFQSPLDTLGKTDYWICFYYSSQKDSLYAVGLWGRLAFMSGYAGWTPSDTTCIEENWKNSDIAMDSAEVNGGSIYRQINPPVYVDIHLGQLNEEYPDSIVWRVDYVTSIFDTFKVYLDAYTCEIIVDIDNPENPTQPTSFELFQNYPNPFNPETKIEFYLPNTSEVKMTIYNVKGQTILSRKIGKMPPGNHQIKWKADNLPSGVYFYKIDAGNFTAIKKCILMK